EAVKKKVPHLERFDTSVFDGIYVTGNVSEAYLQHIESLRNDKARKQDTGDNEVVEIRNTM
ncbi:MAG: amidophosphoribosyltransferase, partial [Thiohalophilus sp.]